LSSAIAGRTAEVHAGRLFDRLRHWFDEAAVFYGLGGIDAGAEFPLQLILHAQGDLPGAREFEEQVLAVRCRVLGEEHPDTLTTMNNLAVTLCTIGERDAALNLMQAASDKRTKVLGSDHPDSQSSAQYVASMRGALTLPPNG
jgi:hypothetical protein